MGKIVAVCRSRKKGTRKETIECGFLKENYGFVDDAHAESSTHRQVSLLAEENVDKIRDLGLDVGPGDFDENMTTEGGELFV